MLRGWKESRVDSQSKLVLVGLAVRCGLSAWPIKSQADQVMASGLTIAEDQYSCRLGGQACQSCGVTLHRQGVH